MTILVTGGSGYIGSHVCLELAQVGYNVISMDNHCNSSPESLYRVEKLTGTQIRQYKADLRNPDDINHIFESHSIEAVIHLAGLKAVGESVEQPLRYYQNNITGTLNLLEAMKRYQVNKLVFSSSATVYGNPDTVPIPETAPIRTTNPYGQTKAMLEAILKDFHAAVPSWSIICLRYFNPVGAHNSGLIGEDPKGTPNNLLPYMAQVASGKLERLRIFGNDYDTPDGTGVRDYIHVCDLADGHLKALEKSWTNPGLFIYNLGSGKGYSVLEILNTFVAVTDHNIPYVITERRPGDIAICYADPSMAERELGWTARRSLRDMCEDAWRWQSYNPYGYDN